jgi:hypothetical protein
LTEKNASKDCGRNVLKKRSAIFFSRASVHFAFYRGECSVEALKARQQRELLIKKFAYFEKKIDLLTTDLEDDLNPILDSE